jgi:two-component system, NtrC family, nitrogen regulation sensor histidine kinase NtrY
VPIGLLAEGTQQVAHGNLDHRIPELGDDELTVLVRDFNIMTKDLKDLTEKLVKGRRYMETVLARVGVGVITIDSHDRITTFNIAAGDILGVSDPFAAVHRDFREVLPKALNEKIVEELEKLYQRQEELVSGEVSVELADTTKHLQLTLTKLVDEKEVLIGTVILLDNITELVSAQRMAAWREVARRIAHEIKNPLTPIQLNAERLQRRFTAGELGGGQGLDDEARMLLTEATDIIVKQVKNLRILVNEFSNFARMPKARLKPGDLNQVVSETVNIFTQSHSGVSISVELDSSIPVFGIDREQIGRALVNLLDNGYASVSHAIAADKNDGLIKVSTVYDESLGLVSLEVSDNGLGIADDDKPKLFEPYFSRKRGGTGLGLAIVRTIVADHNGFIRVYDNEPSGATFVIELPVTREAVGKDTIRAK